MPVIDFDPPDRFVAGTVGPPGQRTFFLQASEGPRVTSVSLEKQQVVVLADRVNDLLDDFAGGEATEDVDDEGDPVVVEEEEDDADRTIFRVVIGPSTARAFARRCTRLVQAGRPPCPL